MINEIIEFLKYKYSGDDYYVQEFGNNIFFGINKEGSIICLKIADKTQEPAKIKTKYLELFQNSSVTITINNETVTDNFNVIIYYNKNDNNIETFVRLCFYYFSNESNCDLLNLMKNLIELFQISSAKNIEYEKGLWGELFTIYYIQKELNIDISNYWHNDFFLKYDFSINDKNKIEVKTTTNNFRIHRVNHEQVFTSNNVLLVSVLIRKDDCGITVFDLFDKIKGLFSNDYNKILKYEQLLRKIEKESAEKFEFAYSVSNIRFFDVTEIPKFDLREPEGVHHTEYDIDLSNINFLGNGQIYDFIRGFAEHE